MCHDRPARRVCVPSILRPTPNRVNVAMAVGLVTACALPGFLSGSTVAQIREDFPLGEAALGIAFSIYWGVAALASTPASKLVERIGAATSMRLAGAIAAGSCAAIVIFVDSALPLIAMLAAGGLSMALATPGANALLVRSVPPDRQALAFGLTQSGPPAGLLLAGIAVPTLAEPLGWRPVFAAAALVALLMACLVRAPAQEGASAAATQRGNPGSNLRRLALVMSGVTFGNASLGALNAFLVAAAPDAGVSGSAAAITLAVGSAATIVLRIALGERADRRGGDALPTVVALLAVGVVGFALVITQSGPLFLGGALLVLVLGWGWMGLFTYAIVTRYAHSPETATGVMQTGFFAGGVLGPVGFGLLVETGSFTLGWASATVAMLVAAASVQAARRLLPPHRSPVEEPPRSSRPAGHHAPRPAGPQSESCTTRQPGQAPARQPASGPPPSSGSG